MASEPGAPSLSGAAATTRIFLLSLLAFPVCYIFNAISAISTLPFGLFAAASFVCFVTYPILSYLLVFSRVRDGLNVYFYVFSVFAFTALVDLLLGFGIAGYVDVLNFYLANGEPYLKSSHGAMINFWDGTFQYGCYLYLPYAMVSGTKHRYAGLIWVGSVMNSILVFLPANVVGKHGADVQFSYLLNIPYALFPILYGVQVLGRPRRRLKAGADAVVSGHASRVFDFALLAFCAGAIALTMVRLLVVLGSPLPLATVWAAGYEPYLTDPSKYPLLQVIIHAVYYVPFFAVAAVALWRGRASTWVWLADYAALIAGGSLQGQFAYVGAAVHNLASYPEPAWVPVPSTGTDVFWGINVALAVVPLLIFLRGRALAVTATHDRRDTKDD